MKVSSLNEGGFTLIELLIVLIIIGILATTAVPQYVKHISTARSSEAPTMLSAMIQYANSYSQAHDNQWPQQEDWTEHFDNRAVYFIYIYDAGDKTLTAKGLGIDPRLGITDKLTYNLSKREWSSEGNLFEIQPVNKTGPSI